MRELSVGKESWARTMIDNNPQGKLVREKNETEK